MRTKLKPGMTANVSIITAQQENVLKLPNAALRYRPAEAVEGAATATRPSRGGGSGEGRMQSARGSGPREGGGEGGSGGHRRPDRVPTRTVYVLSSTNAASKPEARQVRIGISDGVFSEVTEGLNENDIVVIGTNTPEPARQPAGPGAPANPFGGGSRRRF